MCCYILTVENRIYNSHFSFTEHLLCFRSPSSILSMIPCLIVESDDLYDNYFNCTHICEIYFTQTQQLLNETMDVSTGLGSKSVLQIIPRCSINCD